MWRKGGAGGNLLGELTVGVPRRRRKALITIKFRGWVANGIGSSLRLVTGFGVKGVEIKLHGICVCMLVEQGSSSEATCCSAS